MEEQQPTYKITTFCDLWTQFGEFQKRMEEEFRRDIIEYYKIHIMKVKVRNTRKKKVVVPKPVVQNVLTPVKEEVELDNGAVVSTSSSRCSKRMVAKKAQEKISSQLRQTLIEKLRNPETSNKKTKTMSSNESTSSGRKTNASDISAVSVKEQGCEKDEALPSCFVLLDRLPEPKMDEQTKENNIAKSNTPSVNLFSHSSVLEMNKNKSDCVPDISTVCLPNNETVPNNEIVPINDKLPNNNNVTDSDTLPIITIQSSTIITTTFTEDKNTTQSDDHFVFPAPMAIPDRDRPSRVRTKNKKYMSEVFMTNTVPIKSASVSSTGASESVNKSTNSKKGKKRKSDEQINVSTKHAKLSKVVKTSVLEANDIEKETETDFTPHSDVSNDKSKKDKIVSCEENESSTKEIRSRTRVLNKPYNSNIVVIEPEEHETMSDEQPVPEVRVIPPAETPVQRMTRTRTKELNKNLSQVDQSAAKTIASKIAAEIKCGKENKIGHASKLMKSDKGHKISPLSSSNFLFSPSSAAISLSKMTPMKVDSSYKKAEGSTTKVLLDSATKLLPRDVIALEKRNELIKAKTEEVKRKREEKEKRVLVSKQAVEHAKQLKLAKLQKDREEKERLLAESKRMKEEQLLKKKQNAEAMIKEAEERRLKEEEAKKARLLKQEEEKRKQAELRLKMAEDAKKLQELRLAQEAMENEAKLLAAEKKAKPKQKAVEVVSYELTPSKDASDYVPKPLKNEDDYGLSDDSGASTDDEKQPKKVIPKWATKHCRSRQVIIQDKVSSNLVNSFFPLISKDSIELTNIKCHRPRASSAVWNTPGGTSY